MASNDHTECEGVKRKTFLFCKSFPPQQPSLFFFTTDYTIPQTFTVTSGFLLLVFFPLYTLYVVSVRYIKLARSSKFLLISASYSLF